MRFFAKRISAFLADRDGTTAIEYAMMLMLVLLAVLSTVSYFGDSTAESLEDSHAALQTALETRP